MQAFDRIPGGWARAGGRGALLLAGAVLVAAAIGGGTDPASVRGDNASAPITPGPRGNGRLAMVTDRGGDQEIYSMDPDGTRQLDLSRDPGSSDRDPAWSPDGRRIAYASNRTGDYDVYRMRFDGASKMNLTNHLGALDAEPTWSPDGGKVAFTSDRDGNKEIYVMNADGSGQLDLTNTPGASDFQPAWSPDGATIAFTSDRDGKKEIYVMNADGSGQLDLTNTPGASDFQPAWSPDGAAIAFTSDRDGNQEIYLMNADGSGQLDLTNTPDASDFDPVFSPDGGTRIVFTSDRTGFEQVWLLNVYLPTRFTYGLVMVTHQPPEHVTSWQPLPPVEPWQSPIQHIVVLFQENHSFDNVLGKLCVDEARCDGAVEGLLANGSTIPLPPADDISPKVGHSYALQRDAINGGRMDGWSRLQNCGESTGYACFQQYHPDQVPSLSALATTFVISDATFESDTVGSWGGHLNLAAARLNGFYTGRAVQGSGTTGSWGCDGFDLAYWSPTPIDPPIGQPACIPKPDASGAFQETMVPWQPTIMDRFDEAGRTWKIYAPQEGQKQYGWSICPTFADCIYTEQRSNFVYGAQFLSDAANGVLPNLSIVIPLMGQSQHNATSMLKGDNYIGKFVSAAMNGPQWDSTAILITYDDCGCFYDHVPPPPGLGIREPMVIVSPYAKPGYADSNVASFASIPSLAEHVFGLAPLNSEDADAYSYRDTFDFQQTPLPPIELTVHPLPRWERRWLQAHPPEPDFT